MDLDNVREITDREELENFMDPVEIVIRQFLMSREDISPEEKEEIAQKLRAEFKEKET